MVNENHYERKKGILTLLNDLNQPDWNCENWTIEINKVLG